MEHYQGQHGNATRVDEYGNPVSQTEQYGNPGSQTTDQYGNPVHHTGGDKGITEKIKEKIPGAGGGHGQGGYGTTTGTTTGHHGCQDEVDEHGVRRNKGITEKIKENIPGVGGGGGHAGHGQGGHGYDQSHTTSTTTPAGGYQTAATGEHGEKKGIMDKIKEKLPGKN